MPNPTTLPVWQKLCEHYQKILPQHMRDLFAQNPKRFEEFSLESIGLLFDYSKHRITHETMALLLELAREANIESWRDRMFSGEKLISQKNGLYCIQHCATAAISLYW